MRGTRPIVGRIEVAAPGLAAFAARAVSHAPGAVRRRALQSAFDRARDAFNRGDLAVVFALFDAAVEYVPPPALHDGPPLHGREAVFRFWREAFALYEENTIENLALEESTPSRFVRRARLRHRRQGESEPVTYEILQTTELRDGRVVRQVNEPA